jgi:hypothetical protein
LDDLNCCCTRAIDKQSDGFSPGEVEWSVGHVGLKKGGVEFIDGRIERFINWFPGHNEKNVSPCRLVLRESVSKNGRKTGESCEMVRKGLGSIETFKAMRVLNRRAKSIWRHDKRIPHIGEKKVVALKASI